MLGIARLLVLTIPFRWLAPSLGEPKRESDTEMAPGEIRMARIIGQAIRSAAGNTPWQSVCLPQAVAAQWMLKRRRIAATLYLGLARPGKDADQLTAHAWLRCGQIILTGAPGHRKFTVVATFAPEHRRG